MADKCKTCGSLLQSAIEEEYGKCTRHLCDDKMEVARKVVSGVKQANPQTPSSIPQNRAKPASGCIPVLDSDSSKNVALQVRISPAMDRRLDEAVESSGMTKAQFLRAILEDGVTNWR